MPHLGIHRVTSHIVSPLPLGVVGVVLSALVMSACGGGADVAVTPYDRERDHYSAASDRVAFVVTCINEAGFSVSVYQDLSIRVDLPEEQMAALGRAEDICWAEAEARYPAAPPPTAEELYDLNLEAAACLEALGYPIPEPPTKDTWLDAYPGDVLWYPHSYVPNVGEETWLRINRACPQPGTR